MKIARSIFYLDDDNDDLDFFKEVAESLGHTVSIFSNGNLLLEALHSREKPDVIFLDIHMPVLNGEEILNIIKNSDDWNEIPVVMVSGAYPKKLIKYFLDIGVNYLMKKPHINDFRDAVEKILKVDLYKFQQGN